MSGSRVGIGKGMAVGLAAWAVVVGAWTSARGQAKDEVDLHLARMRPLLEDAGKSAAERGDLALELAATLDRDAQAAQTVDRARARWNEAAVLLERFLAESPDNPRERSLALQAGVYRWA